MKAPAANRAAALRDLVANPSPVVFAGPPGSGKSRAAQQIATTLGVDLRRVDVSRLISPDIGETEKNIDRLFAAAERDGAVLVFDEADALFGRRTEVHDAHDRYANIEINHLLARIEAHRGAVIVTTHDSQALDPAVVRRLGPVIEFHPPKATGG